MRLILLGLFVCCLAIAVNGVPFGKNMTFYYMVIEDKNSTIITY